MPNNHVLLQRSELTVSASSVVFSNLPQTGYTDLRLEVSSRVTTGGGQGNNVLIRFNGDTGSNYLFKALEAYNGTVVQSYQGSSVTRALFSGATTDATTTNLFGILRLYIPNYTSSVFKSISGEGWAEYNSASLGPGGIYTNLWSSTAAITSVTVYSNADWAAGSTFSLYGIAATGTTPASAPKARGGNTVVTDGTYWYHAFTSSGTFTPLAALTADYLVIGGGGGGGRDYYAGGGGGAGGLRSTVTATGGGGSLESAISLSAQNYTVTIGAGGAAAGAGGGTNGSDSTLSTVTAIGGGGGGGNNSDSSSSGVGVAGRTGGSGGGGGSFGASGAGTTNRGYAGGSSSSNGGAGGGGAGVAGSSTSSGDGAAGGNGVSISAFATATGTGVSNYYAGGGAGAGNARVGGPAGAAGGAGGGGSSPNQAGNGQVAAIANTGGGGYGGNGNRGPGDGASGLVIIRYAV